MRQAIILAGGKGTRLRERLKGLPKPMIDVCGVPLIERQILLLKEYNFEHVIILVNYESDKIVEFCEQRNNWGINVQCINDGEPLGTAGALLKIVGILNDCFLVVYGDTLFDVDLNRFYCFHAQNVRPSVTLFLHPNDHPVDSDLVEVDEYGRIVNFHPYPHSEDTFYSNLVNAALYWIDRDTLLPWAESTSFLDFGRDIFPSMLKMGIVLSGYKSVEYIKDCGTPLRLDKVCCDLMSGKVERSGFKIKKKAVFLDRDGTINEEVGHLVDVNDFKLIAGAADSIRLLNKNEFKTCVVTNQPVLARGECNGNELSRIHKKMETLLGKNGAYIDAIYYCPHHPDAGYDGEVAHLKVKCNCRKPLIGMIQNAVNEINIDIGQSWMIGDTTTDILTAKNAGLKSIIVETGYAGLDSKFLVTSDFICPDVYSACVFIVEKYPQMYTLCKQHLQKIPKVGIVRIGGLSRSGKTTFANVVKYFLQDHGYIVHLISIDRWIKSEQDRSSTVLGRYDIDELRNVIEKILDRKEALSLSIPFYNRKTKQRIDNAEILSIGCDDIILLEGTLAISVGGSLLRSTVDFFVEIDESERKSRVIKEYTLRGMTAVEAERIYAMRNEDEAPYVINSAASAIRINIENFLSN